MNKFIPPVLAIIIMMSLGVYEVFAQVVSGSGFHLQYPMLVNPAAAGIPPATEALMSYRDQWSGFEGAPKLLQAAIHGRFKQNTGLGALLKSYQWGIFNDNSAAFMYAHQVNFSADHKLRLGASAGFFQRSINQNRLDVENPDGDMVLNDQYSNDMFMKFGMGVMYHWKQLTISVSSPDIYNGTAQSMFSQHIMWLSYNYKLPASEAALKPIVQIRTGNTNPIQALCALQGSWKDLAWLQLGYNTHNNILVSTGFNYDKLGFGYAFEKNNGKLNYFSYGSHEVLLSYRFSSKEDKK